MLTNFGLLEDVHTLHDSRLFEVKISKNTFHFIFKSNFLEGSAKGMQCVADFINGTMFINNCFLRSVQCTSLEEKADVFATVKKVFVKIFSLVISAMKDNPMTLDIKVIDQTMAFLSQLVRLFR